MASLKLNYSSWPENPCCFPCPTGLKTRSWFWHPSTVRMCIKLHLKPPALLHRGTWFLAIVFLKWLCLSAGTLGYLLFPASPVKHFSLETSQKPERSFSKTASARQFAFSLELCRVVSGLILHLLSCTVGCFDTVLDSTLLRQSVSTNVCSSAS